MIELFHIADIIFVLFQLNLKKRLNQIFGALFDLENECGFIRIFFQPSIRRFFFLSLSSNVYPMNAFLFV